MTKLLMLSAALSLVLVAGGANLSFAAGTGDDTSTNPATKCKKGEVWNKKTKKCEKAASGLLPDEELYQQGRQLAKTGHYDWALQVFQAVSNQSDPRVLNYIGYSYRKSGDFATGLAYYRKALAIDPNFVLAREYLGEGYVATGHIELAKLQLSEIGNRCGTSCDEYKELAENIADAVN